MKNGRKFQMICPRCHTIIESVTLEIPSDSLESQIPDELSLAQRDSFVAGWLRAMCREIPRMEQQCPTCRGIDFLDR